MHEDWCFRHYLKASDLAKRMKEEEYQLFVFDEMFKTNRIELSKELKKKSSIAE